MIELPLMLFPDTAENLKYKMTNEEGILIPSYFQVGDRLDPGCLEDPPPIQLSPA